MDNYYVSGQYNFVCDVCGQWYKSSQMKKRWDGAIVCPKDWEIRQPQDFVRGRRDNMSVPVARPNPPDEFVSQLCTLIGSCGAVGFGTVGCMIVGRTIPPGFNLYQ